ncbi:putative glutaredoxin [Hamiltosporidium tvaerminnensis]|uniref:Putative glutaredoxin n=2 Tax=Hamiltosporidium TaxID=1176354 RepID=A0A4Q9KVE6_9MICR|nr:putative glutaredoxin [Hamiltosporidium magnivora]TBT99462.1 putative glutaredoxin [Hamiltosporidium tvaerminnensis]TBU07754.1 putative glutaredoxin [Hamiltosporidium magnivora]TBU12054.1 putative glutaredoxin [Hamiltosporidium tvaerminnensis]
MKIQNKMENREVEIQENEKLEKELEEKLQENENIMLGKEICPFTTAAQDLLKQREISYKYYPKESNPLLTQAISSLHGGKTFPQVFLKKKYIGGLNEMQIYFNADCNNREE